LISAKPYRINRSRANVGAWFIIGLMLLWPIHGMTQTNAGEDDGARGKKIHITADKLVSDGNTNYIRFSGTVTTVYDDTTIHSDNMEVFYENMATDSNRMAEENIKKIVASGRVSIRFGERTAYCDQAVYMAATRTIVMTGENTRIQSGNDYITGKKITIDQNKGSATVDGGPDQRVNAVFRTQNTETIAPGTIEDHDDAGAQ
jgi:lipopolysaccharide export system protein LptA